MIIKKVTAAVRAITAEDVNVAVWGGAYLISQTGIAVILGPAGPKLLAIQTAPTARRYRAVVDSLTPRELKGYRAHFIPDTFHPFIYRAALHAGIAGVVSHGGMSERKARLLRRAVTYSTAADLVENVLDLALLERRAWITPATATTATAISTSKWVAALGSLGVIGVGYLGIVRGGLARE